MKFDIDKHLTKQEVISTKNVYLSHLVKHQKKYLILLLLIVLGIPLFSNYLQDEPLIMGGESYFHLSQTEVISNYTFYYWPLKIINSFLPEQLLFLTPLFFAICSILMFIEVMKKTNFTMRSTFFFLTLLIISPAFIFTFITISAYSLSIFSILLGFLLLSKKKKGWQYLSLVPFVMVTLIDIYSTFLLLLLLGIYLYFEEKRGKKEEIKKLKTIKSIFIIIITLTIVNFLIFNLNIFQGPFHNQQLIPDLLSDLGGLSGINFFTLLLSLIGLSITWKKKGFSFAYIILPFTIMAYIFNTQTILYLTIILTFFATVGITKLFERNWNLVALKRFTFFILVLGLLFSTITYLERVSDNSPTKSEIEVLTWMNNNIPIEKVVFSDPENSYFINYFAEQRPFYQLNEKRFFKKEQTQGILSALYIDELFPLLEQNEIKTIYISEKMNSKLSKEQGLLFLLKNERFKIVHSYEGNEVWEFKKE